MQPWENCNAEKLPYYTPVEAGIRWCGLTKYEPEILANIREKGEGVRFPQWPCLQPRIAELRYAMRAGEIPHGIDGNPKLDGQSRSESRWTMTHADLRRWFKENSPQTEWPAFLFDEIERKTHAAISADAFRALQADRDAARAELEKAKAGAAETIREMGAMRGERDSLRAMVEKASAPGGRSEKTYLNIIGGLLALMLGKSPSGKSQSSFENQGAVISAMLAHYGHIKGMGDSNLEKIMAEANKTLKESAISGG